MYSKLITKEFERRHN